MLSYNDQLNGILFVLGSFFTIFGLVLLGLEKIRKVTTYQDRDSLIATTNTNTKNDNKCKRIRIKKH